MSKTVRVISLIVLMVLVSMVLVGCSSSSSRSSYNGYSQTYNNNAGYRNNVNDIADVYGEDPQKVDAVINALTKGK